MESREREQPILVLFHEKYRDCSKITTAKCSTHPLLGWLCTHSCREERRYRGTQTCKKGSRREAATVDRVKPFRVEKHPPSPSVTTLS